MLGFFDIMIYINDDISSFDLTAAMPRLTDQRREQVLRFRHELGQQEHQTLCGEEEPK